MTTRIKIVGSNWDYAGWVEIDPFDYNYMGEDPDGEIENYLSRVKSGDITYGWPNDYATDEDYPSKLKIMSIKQRLEGFDEIWKLKFPDDFEHHPILK